MDEHREGGLGEWASTGVAEDGPSAGADEALAGFTDLTRDWFAQRFGAPTAPQRLGWPSIQAGLDTLIAAPTGSGKTLAAFLASLDRLFEAGCAGRLEEGVHTLYVTPLKALSNDIHRNLQTPLEELTRGAKAAGWPSFEVRAALRTGDTPSHLRQSMARKPPHILVTTPESLYMLLTSSRARTMLRGVRAVIVDEIHALVRDKRGSHLSLSLERLEAICDAPPVRVGLSATQRPIEEIAAFLVGAGRLDESGRPRCRIVDAGFVRKLDLDVLTPADELGAVATREQWNQIHERLVALIESHRATLVFVNTRRMAERLSYALAERLGKEKVSSHHGSLSKETRLDAERRLKDGELKAIVATASLELGIDVGYVDLVCQIGSARSIAATVQRIGRSGHSLGAAPKGRIFALTRDDLLESLATVRAIRRGTLDSVFPPRQPLDILAQQIVAAAATDEWREDDLYALVRRAWPYRNLSREEFDEVVAMASQPTGGLRPPVRLHRDQIHGRLRAPRGARMIATSCGGAIPDNADFRVVTTDGGVVGGVNEDFAIESLPGDVFLLGTTSWRIVQVRGSDVVVEDAHGAAPSIPFWIGEAPGRTKELSREVGALRGEITARIPDDDPTDWRGAAEWLAAETSASGPAVEQAVRYVAAQKAALGVVPTHESVVFERFFDETGGMQLVIHAPFGSRVNRGWGLAMRKRFCRSFDFELQASADDNGIVLSLGPQHSVPLEDLFSIVNVRNARHMLEQAALDSPLFRIRWRWNAARSLLVLRQRGGKRVPPALQRFRADDMLTAIFPASTACLENRPADVEIPDHPMVRQTMHDCLHEAADLDEWTSILSRIERGEIRLEARETTEPSPFAHERLNAMPYAFLDDAPLEERRARAVQYRRSIPIEEVGDLARLDPEVVAEVREQAWPRARSADEFHEMLLQMQVLREEEVAARSAGAEPGSGSDWSAYLDALLAAGRATVATTAGNARFAVALERWPQFRAAYPSATCEPRSALPARLDVAVEPQDARVAVVRGRIEAAGPTTVGQLSAVLDMPPEQVDAALVRLEVEGAVLRGRFDPALEGVQWCDRRLLARIHRRTLDGARRRVQPVSAANFLRFALQHQGVSGGASRGQADREGPGGLFEVVAQLAGIEAPTGAWEQDIFPARVRDYDPAWLDELTFTGAVGWGRLAPPAAPSDRKRLAGLNRAVPISIFPREDLAWLLPPNRVSAEDQARSGARDVWKTLRDQGALFLSDLLAAAELLPSQLDEALGELAALGLVTADGFAGIRALATPVRSQSRAARRRRSLRGRSAAMGRSISGRWSVFPAVATSTPGDRAERWARLLLSRYGVVFRDLLERESVAPPWWELVRVYRLMEARGEVHGGRFVQGVGYEQYALPGAVEALRRASEAVAPGAWVVLSAADPLNLTGILDLGPRVPATRGNSLAIRDGQVVARCVGGETTWDAELDSQTREEVSRKLLAGGPSRWRNRARAGPEPPLLPGASAGGARGQENGLLF